MTVDQALGLGAALDQLNAADSMVEIRNSAAEALSFMQALTDSGVELPGPLLDAASALEEIVRSSAEAVATVDQAGSAASVLAGGLFDAASAALSLSASGPQAGWLSGAIGDAATLAATLWNAASAAAAAGDRTVNRQMQAYQLFGNVRNQTPENAPFTGPDPQTRPNNIEFGIPDLSGGGGGGGGGGGAAASNRDFLDSQREAERIFESTRTELEKYNAAVDRADELLDSGALSMDTYTRYVDELRESLKDPVGDEFRKQIQGISQDLAGAIVHADSFQGALDAIGDVFASNIQKMAQDLISSGLDDLMSQVFGGITGGGDFWSSLFGGKSGPIMSGGPKSFAGGGHTGTGPRSGGMDGIGGFPAMLHPDEFVVDMKRAGSRSAGLP